jgi:hypothetical protein
MHVTQEVHYRERSCSQPKQIRRHGLNANSKTAGNRDMLLWATIQQSAVTTVIYKKAFGCLACALQHGFM